MKPLLAVIAFFEAAFGLLLLVFPAGIVRLIFNAELAGIGTIAGRVAGIAIFALGVACWKGGTPEGALNGLLVYSVLVALYVLLIGIRGGFTGALLWPVVGIHAGLAIVLARERFDDWKGARAKRSD